MVEAWLRMKREARMRGVRTEAALESTVAACGVCGVWRGRGEGCAPRCESTLCPGGREPTEEGVGNACVDYRMGCQERCCKRGAPPNALVSGST